VSGPSLILSGYLAGIQLHGPTPADVLELKSSVELVGSRVRGHVAQTLDVAASGDAFRDVSAGGAITLGRVRLVGEAHAVNTWPGDDTGTAAFGAAAVQLGRTELLLGAGAVWSGRRSDELVVTATRTRITPRLDGSATLVISDGHASLGGHLAVRLSKRAGLALDAFAGTRSRALLSEGQTLESMSGTQHELACAIASYDLGLTGTVFAGAQVRRDADEGNSHLVTVALAGTSMTF
jgi:hypothetical protein